MRQELKRALIEYITGKWQEVHLRGHPTQIVVIYEAAQASRRLFEALSADDIDVVKKTLETKREAVERYERVFGKSWGL